MASNSDYTTVIKPHAGLFNLKLREVWAYRDLVFILARRDIVAVYKQTILGPLWFLVSPVLTVVVYMFVFGSIAGISTDGMPQAVLPWWYYPLELFSRFTATANPSQQTLKFWQGIFPKNCCPDGQCLVNMVKLFIQMPLFVGVGYYLGQNDSTIHLTEEMYLLPVLILMMAGLSLGIGIIISSLTTKYRDFKNFIGFGVSLLMYASPVIYPISAVKDKGYGHC